MGGSLDDVVSDHDSATGMPLRSSGEDTHSNNSEENTMVEVTKIRMLEFFSGIGGMRVSLENALRLLNNRDSDRYCDQTTATATGRKRRLVLESCRAYDISLHANNVYQHNFCGDNNSSKKGDKKHSVCTKLVEQLQPKDILPLQANLWTMSPPCQPFTTNGEGRGKQRLDASDKRCNGLKGIAKLLTSLPPKDKPKWILLENVKGFAQSAMCELWCECLNGNGYSYRSFLLSPVEFGIPNHRMRYYLLAELHSKRWSSPTDSEGCSNSSGEVENAENKGIDGPLTTTASATPEVHSITSLSAYDEIAKRPKHKVGRYVFEDYSPPSNEPLSTTENTTDKHHHHCTDLDPYLVPPKVLAKAWSKGLGIVSANDTATHCFTAGYGRIYHRSTGSLLLRKGSRADLARGGAALQALPLDRSDMGRYENQLRRFSPEELLRLFGFVNADENHADNAQDVDGDGDNNNNSHARQKRVFAIPSTVVPSLEQRYKLIGNSISVNVVTELLRELLLSA